MGDVKEVFDLYGYDLDSHENAYYSEGDFEETVRQICHMNKCKLKVNLIINYRNIDYLNKMLVFVKELNIQNIEIKYYSLINRSFKTLDESRLISNVLSRIRNATRLLMMVGINVIIGDENPLKTFVLLNDNNLWLDFFTEDIETSSEPIAMLRKMLLMIDKNNDIRIRIFLNNSNYDILSGFDKIFQYIKSYNFVFHFDNFILSDNYIVAKKTMNQILSYLNILREKEYSFTISSNGSIGDALKEDCAVEIISRCRDDNKSINKMEYRQRKTRLSSYPRFVFLELTRNCNCRCIMCEHSKMYKHNDKKLNMPLFAYKKIADQIFPYVEVVDMRGFGESLLHPDFVEMVKYGSKYGVKYRIITNLNVDKKDYLDVMIENDFLIICSLDGHTKELFESIRRDSDFELISKNARYITQRTGNALVSCALIPKNRKYVLDIVKFCESLGFKRIGFNMDMRMYLKKNMLMEVVQQMKDVLKYAKKRGLKIDSNFEHSYIKDPHSIKKQISLCPKPWDILYIAYNGLLGPCDCRFDEQWFLGDLARNNFKEIWNNRNFVLFRNMIINNEINHCKECNLKFFY